MEELNQSAQGEAINEQSANTPIARNRIDVSRVQHTVAKVKAELHKVIIGQDELMDLLLASLFVNGHVF